MTTATVMRLEFQGNKEGSNLAVSYALNLPCTTKEFDDFVAGAKKHGGAKEIEVAPNLFFQFKRGGNKAVMKYQGKTTVYDQLETAVDEYFNIPSDETLIYEATEEDSEDDEGNENGTETVQD